MEESDLSSQIHRTVCAHDCPDACAIDVTVDKGRVVQFRGSATHPVTRGFLCAKVNAYDKIVNSPDRILQPLKRVGPKGEGRFEPISWPEALRLAGERVTSARERHGGESVVLYYYAGTMGYVHRYCAEALFNRLGATRLRSNICYYGSDAGYQAVVGGGYGLDPEDMVHADFVVVWGSNVVTTQVHLVPFIDEARRRGAPLWVVDPYRNRTARKADSWVCVRPGTDTVLALGLLHILEETDAVDRDFIARRTTGYERLRDQVLPKYPPERTAEITGVPRRTIEELAGKLARARAPVFKVGVGLGRNSHGGAGVRAICCLAGALGAYEKLGGGVQYDTGCEFRLNLDPLMRPDWRRETARELNMTDLSRALTEWDTPPVEFLYVHGSNPAATAPEQGLLREGLRRTDLFTVVHERFLTDTALFADLVLPAVSFVESSDLFKAYGHLYLQYGRRVIEPLGECRSNLAVVQALGRELGYDDPWFEKSPEELIDEILDATDHPNFRGLNREQLFRGEPFRLQVPRGGSGFHGGFGTVSGKLEFESSLLESQGLPAVVDYEGDPFNTDPQRYPFRLLTPPAHSFLNSSFGEQEASRRKEGSEPSVLVHPQDARNNEGLGDGDEVELFNDLGTVRMVARVSQDTQPGVLVAEGIWWPSCGRDGAGVNVLTSRRLTDLGGGSTFHDNRVGLRRA